MLLLAELSSEPPSVIVVWNEAVLAMDDAVAEALFVLEVAEGVGVGVGVEEEVMTVPVDWHQARATMQTAETMLRIFMLK